MADDQDDINFYSACDRVLAAVENVNDQDVYDVLIAVASYRMASLCLERRKAAARYIEEQIPNMLVDANETAELLARTHASAHTNARVQSDASLTIKPSLSHRGALGIFR
jgi:hypothetical protein